MTPSQVRLADALDRLDQHHTLHLPLRRTDLIGRLAVRVLWRRHLKWQMETNIAVRDAVSAVREAIDQQRAELAEVANRPGPDLSGLATVERLSTELDRLRVSDQTMISGLNQRLYAAVGSLRTELSDLRMHLADKAGADQDTEDRLTAVQAQVADVVAQARAARGRNARLDLLLDRLRTDPKDTTAAVADAPNRRDALEFALYELLDGPAERVREDREAYLRPVRAAGPSGGAGAVFDVAPGRGEWLEVLRANGIDARGASVNPLVVHACVDAGLAVAQADPVDALAAVPHRSLTAVTAFRYAERVSPETLARLVDAASQALAPGGLLVVECQTDPAADPLAHRPVHPVFARFLAESAGFGRVQAREPGPGPLAEWPADLTKPAAGDRFCLLAWR